MGSYQGLISGGHTKGPRNVDDLEERALKITFALSLYTRSILSFFSVFRLFQIPGDARRVVRTRLWAPIAVALVYSRTITDNI